MSIEANFVKRGVFVIEDNPDYLGTIVEVFESRGLPVTGQTGDYKTALAVASALPMGTQIVTLDSQLIMGDQEGETGRKVLSILREYHPEVYIVSLSSGMPLVGADLFHSKRDGLTELAQILLTLSLPNPK